MQTWTCEKCGRQNPIYDKTCNQCGFPNEPTMEQRQALPGTNVLQSSIEQQPLPDYIYISKTIENFGKAQLEVLHSLNSKLTFIVIVIIIGIAIQILSSCIHL